MKSFKELLKVSVERHGHLCAGQVIGVRMAMLGCRLVGIDDPHSPQFRKSLIVYVEIDRCATDAIESVTGCRLGRRSLKFKDYGINAATFLNLDTSVAYRIVSTEESRELCARYAPQADNPKQQQLIGYERMPDDALFDIQQVRVKLDEWDMPGPTRRRVECQKCGQMVRDGKERVRDGASLCRHCAGEGYFEVIADAQDGLVDKKEALA
jgi:formylmethanofuran dehydrogenase subunit E